MTMMAVDVQGLLRVWEEQQHAHPVRRALHLLAQACPEPGWDGWLHAPIGTRDAALLALQRRLFGGSLQTTSACRHCGERLEAAFDVDDVRASRAAETPDNAPPWRLQQHDYAIDYRLPTSDDLLQLTARHAADADADAGADADAAVAADAQTAARLLMQRCVSAARRAGDPVDVAALPDAVVDTLGAAIARRDPDADVRITLACPACGRESQLHFDIVSYVWSELDDWAQRLLADVHVLARAYGWSEASILALSPARRALYLEMVAA